jgi:regulator of RNase E activity RraA
MSEEIAARFRALSTSVVCDAYLKSGLRPAERVVPHGLGRVTGTGIVVGRARTVQLELVRDRERSALVSNRPLQFEIADGASAGEVLVFAAPQGLPYAIFGGILALKADERGVAGVVVDGATRDVPEIEEAGMSVWCRSVTPIPGGYAGYSVRAVNVPVSCAGVEIHPGDYIIGDSDGVIVVPVGDVDVILAESEQMYDREQVTREAVGRGETLLASYPSRDYYRENA